MECLDDGKRFDVRLGLHQTIVRRRASLQITVPLGPQVLSPVAVMESSHLKPPWCESVPGLRTLRRDWRSGWRSRKIGEAQTSTSPRKLGTPMFLIIPRRSRLDAWLLIVSCRRLAVAERSHGFVVEMNGHCLGHV